MSLIIFFIGWFYIEQLGFPNTVSNKTNNARYKNIEEINSKSGAIVEPDLTRMNSLGAVGVGVTLPPEKSTSNELLFEIAMNTHSVDLLLYPLNELASPSFGELGNASGEFEWELTNENSHHLVGYLKWKGTVIEESVILEIKNIDNVPIRTFKWEKSEI